MWLRGAKGGLFFEKVRTCPRSQERGSPKNQSGSPVGQKGPKGHGTPSALYFFYWACAGFAWRVSQRYQQAGYGSRALDWLEVVDSGAGQGTCSRGTWAEMRMGVLFFAQKLKRHRLATSAVHRIWRLRHGARLLAHSRLLVMPPSEFGSSKSMSTNACRVVFGQNRTERQDSLALLGLNA